MLSKDTRKLFLTAEPSNTAPQSVSLGSASSWSALQTELCKWRFPPASPSMYVTVPTAPAPLRRGSNGKQPEIAIKFSSCKYAKPQVGKSCIGWWLKQVESRKEVESLLPHSLMHVVLARSATLQ